MCAAARVQSTRSRSCDWGGGGAVGRSGGEMNTETHLR